MLSKGNILFINMDSVRLKVYDSALTKNYDERTTLVFLHGSPGQISNWKYQIKYFEQYYRVIAYDQRGYGESTKPKKVSLNDYLDDLTRILENRNLEIEDVILVGHSFGGMVAQAYAAKNKVKGLVLVGSLVKLRPDIIDWIVWYLPSIFWKRLFFTENFLTRKLYRQIFFSDYAPDEIYEEFIRDNADYISSLPGHAFRYLKYFRDYDATAFLSEIKSPTLIIVGEHDKVAPPDQSKNIHEKIPGSELVIVEKAGHFVLYEKEEEINNLIHSFIKSL